MEFVNNLRWPQISTMIGSFLLLSSLSIIMFWGNLSVYVFSYFMSNGSLISAGQSSWVISIFLAAMTAGMLASGVLSHTFGRKTSIFIGIVLVDVAILSGYYAIDSSYMLFVLMISLVQGFGVGMISPVAQEFALDWSGKYPGIINTMVTSSRYIAGSIANNLITAYINPNNETPNLIIGQSKLFTQIHIIDRVPSTFMIYLICLIIVHIFGLCLLRDFPKENVEMKQIILDTCEINSQNDTNDEANESTLNTNETDQIRINSQKQNTAQIIKTLLSSKYFYVLLFVANIADICAVCTSTYYKEFGQLDIHDDTLLTTLGTVSVLTMVPIAMLFGHACDKYGVKLTYMTLLFGNCVIAAFYGFTPRVDKWLYSFWTVTFFGLSGSIYSVVTPGIVCLLGKERFSLISSFVWSLTLVFSSLIPIVFNFILSSTNSWFALFQCVALVNFLGGLTVMKVI